eukprot:3537939-Amphidinium_carterae.1
MSLERHTEQFSMQIISSIDVLQQQLSVLSDEQKQKTHSRSKETIHAMSPRGQVGRMLTCDVMGNKECLILVGDPEEAQIVKGLKPHPVPAE